MSEQLTLDSALELETCDCERRSTCPRCDPNYTEQDGDRAAGLITAGRVPYNVIPY